ncbi:MAG: hypothetical protein ACKPFJ_19350 [Dolichospermum sp.]
MLVVSGQWLVVGCQLLVVGCQWLVVGGQWSAKYLLLLPSLREFNDEEGT